MKAYLAKWIYHLIRPWMRLRAARSQGGWQLQFTVFDEELFRMQLGADDITAEIRAEMKKEQDERQRRQQSAPPPVYWTHVGSAGSANLSELNEYMRRNRP